MFLRRVVMYGTRHTGDLFDGTGARVFNCGGFTCVTLDFLIMRVVTSFLRETEYRMSFKSSYTSIETEGPFL